MVTTSPDNLWSPNATDPYNLTTDLAAMQTSVQNALTNRPRTYRTDLTDAQRLALSGSELFEGLRVRVTDTKVDWVYTSGSWSREGSGPVAHNTNPGAGIAGVTVPTSAISLPQGLQVKTGMVTSIPSPQFGNEYMPRVVFAQPFPNALLSISVFQVGTDGATPYANFATDDAKKDGFRLFYVGTSTTTKRSFLWTAFGY